MNLASADRRERNGPSPCGLSNNHPASKLYAYRKDDRGRPGRPGRRMRSGSGTGRGVKDRCQVYSCLPAENLCI